MICWGVRVYGCVIKSSYGVVIDRCGVELTAVPKEAEPEDVLSVPSGLEEVSCRVW